MNSSSALLAWSAQAERWLAERLPRREADAVKDSYAVFEVVGHEEMAELLAAAGAWQREKLAAGYGAITLDRDVGGSGLTVSHAQAFRRLEARFRTPPITELVSVTLDLVVPTITVHGTVDQRREWLPQLLSGERWACQLFSEPDAGSDLASLSCRARPVAGGWVVTGQKVWTSGARFASVGLLLARTGTAGHPGITAFLVPLDAPGVAVSPIRQMAGGSTFSQVHFADVTVGDHLRLGEVGSGWSVARTVLGFERAASGSGQDPGAGFAEALATARRVGRTADPLVRQQLARLYTAEVVQARFGEAVDQLAGRGQLTAQGSVLKLLWVRTLMLASSLGSSLAGAHLTTAADGDLHRWVDHVLGAPGYRIAGGTDEIQRTIIGERMLGLPREPRQ